MLAEAWQLLDVTRCTTAQPWAEAWEQLARVSLVPAGLNRPSLQLPILGATPGAELLLVSEGRRALLALPVVPARFPVAVRSLATPLSASGLPHVDANLAEPALTAALRHLNGPLLLRGVPAYGPLQEVLQRVAPHHAVLDRWQRAGLTIAGTYESWFERNFDRKRRNALRRLRSRLAEKGRLESRTLARSGDVSSFCDDFLSLEAAGWKGRRGTALNLDSGIAQAFRAAMTGLHAEGHLRFWSLALDGHTIVTLYAIVDDGTAWLGKIAYDEKLAKSSPGVLMILEATAQLFAEPGLVLADSCAIPEHPMIDNLWRDRLAMADVLVAGPQVGALHFGAAVVAEQFRRRSRAAVRDAWYAFRGWHRS